jgi:hypothetical protein
MSDIVPTTIQRYEILVGHPGTYEWGTDDVTYVVTAASEQDALFQAGATHVVEGRHAGGVVVKAIRSEADAYADGASITT